MGPGLSGPAVPTHCDGMMDHDLEGRIMRIAPPGPVSSYYPLYEAISNAIDAIREADASSGRVEIEIRREPIGGTFEGMETSAPIVSVIVSDNGIGLTDQHFEAFGRTNTQHKIAFGGKGVGRLQWLRAFDHALVDSIYRGPKGLRRRSFRFCLPEGIPDDSVSDEPVEKDRPQTTGTSISLVEMKPEYRKLMRHKLSTLAGAIAHHHLPALLGPNPPKIVLRDETGVVEADPGFDSKETTTFEVDGHQFTVHHLRSRVSVSPQSHNAIYCARDRVVETDRLRFLPRSPLVDEGAGEVFFYHAYVHSKFLDAHVDEDRSGFRIANERGLAVLGMSDIAAALQSQSANFLAPQLEKLYAQKDHRVTRVLRERLPEYEYLLVQNRAAIELIPIDYDENQIAESLANMHLRNQANGREALSGIISQLRHGEATLDVESFKTRYAESIAKISGPSQASLAGYLVYRRSIIELLEQILLRTADSEFQREAAIHTLLFPKKVAVDTSAARVPNNLWLVDERLTFADYIASDKPLDEHSQLFDVGSTDRPDIACYFNLGFSEEDPSRGDLHTIVLVELKRPGPVPSSPETPWDQCYRYIERIREGAYTEGGQKIKATDATRFYCYIVCDLDGRTIDRMKNRYPFQEIFDATEGHYLYNDKLRAYVELIPFERVLRDADRKHRAFFDHLGLIKHR